VSRRARIIYLFFSAVAVFPANDFGIEIEITRNRARTRIILSPPNIARASGLRLCKWILGRVPAVNKYFRENIPIIYYRYPFTDWI